jgi:hypothetical protein
VKNSAIRDNCDTRRSTTNIHDGRRALIIRSDTGAERCGDSFFYQPNTTDVRMLRGIQ